MATVTSPSWTRAPSSANEPLTIAVLGVTGAGKSTFIKSVSKDPNIVVGNQLMSCTAKAASYTFTHKNTTYRLIDTPGFDDTTRSDKEILNEIASWLSSNLQGVKLAGVIYFHRITDTRMQGTELRNLRTFQRILGGGGACAANGLGSVVLATTFWDKIDEAEGARKEEDLAELWSNGEKSSSLGKVDMWRLDGRGPAGLMLLERIKRKQARGGRASNSIDVSGMVARIQEDERRERQRVEEEERRHRARIEEMQRQARRDMEARRQAAMREREVHRAMAEERLRAVRAQQAAMRPAYTYDSDSDSDSCIIM